VGQRSRSGQSKRRIKNTQTRGRLRAAQGDDMEYILLLLSVLVGYLNWKFICLNQESKVLTKLLEGFAEKQVNTDKGVRRGIYNISINSLRLVC